MISGFSFMRPPLYIERFPFVKSIWEIREYIVLIPDPEPGAMWYKFTLAPQAALGTGPQ